MICQKNRTQTAFRPWFPSQSQIMVIISDMVLSFFNQKMELCCMHISVILLLSLAQERFVGQFPKTQQTYLPEATQWSEYSTKPPFKLPP